MADKLKDRLKHAVLALLLSAGLAMPVAGALDETLISPRMLFLISAVILAFETASLHRAGIAAAGCLAAAALGVWLFSGNGIQLLSDAGIAVNLRLKGIRTAIPLAADVVSSAVAAGMTLLCCFAAYRRVTCIPALTLTTMAAAALWLTNSMHLLPWLLPAIAAVLAMLMVSQHEDTPAVRILPWTAGLVAAAFLLAGSGPADNPLKEKMDEIRQAVMDRLFFTEARDVFSLYSVGFSPQGAEQLGGKPNPSGNPVMQVSTPKTAYLRGTVYNRYTGHGWQNTTGGRRYLWQSRVMAERRAALFDEALPPVSAQNSMSEPATVFVRMLNGSASTLFVPQRVRELNPGGETVPYFSNSSEIYITRNLQAGDTWEVKAPLYQSTDPGIGTLTDICATLGDFRWTEVCNTYLELPGHLEQPVADLAAEIVSAAGTPFEKAMALQNYLTRNYRYTLDVGEHPENIDFVTSFLLETKKGYCTYFASAMTVLCRLAGLPARYVEGYLAEPDENGEALVTGMDAHAWTEVYFYGFGWLTFDATPGRRLPGRPEGNGQQNNPTPAPSPEDKGNPPPEPASSEIPENSDGQESEASEPPSGSPDEEPPADHPPGTSGSFPWWLLIVLLVSVCGIRILITSPAFLEKRARTEEQRFSIWAEETEKLLRAEQLERRNGETPMMFARRADSTALFSESVVPAGECLARISYSRAEPQEQDTGLMKDTAMLVRSELSKQAKIRYWIRRLTGRK